MQVCIRKCWSKIRSLRYWIFRIRNLHANVFVQYFAEPCIYSQIVNCAWQLWIVLDTQIRAGATLPLHYGLSNVNIRDQNFAKVIKSKTLLVANFWTKRAQIFSKRSRTAKILQQIFFYIFFNEKMGKFWHIIAKTWRAGPTNLKLSMACRNLWVKLWWQPFIAIDLL